MARQQERQEILKWKVFNSALVLHIKDYKDQNSYWTTFYLNWLPFTSGISFFLKKKNPTIHELQMFHLILCDTEVTKW